MALWVVEVETTEGIQVVQVEAPDTWEALQNAENLVSERGKKVLGSRQPRRKATNQG
jgi:hypothetical protein